jgi:hypothetical protein
MDSSKIAEINMEDLFADTNLEIEEISSLIKIICCALENLKYKESEIKDIDSVLFMLQGKLSTVKNNLRIMENK